MPKIALVHEMLVKLGGAERVLKVLMDMFPQSDLFTLFYSEKKCGFVFPKEKVKTSFLQKYVNLGIPYQLLISKMPLAIESFDFSDYDLVISSSSAFAHGVLTNVGTKHICYCHSPMRYAWDYTNEYKKEKGGRLKQFLISKLLKPVRMWDQIAANRTDLYLANSDNVQKRIQKYYHLPARILYPPVDLQRFQINQRNDGYYLIVSTLSAYKRIDLAVETFNQTGQKLIIIGEGQNKQKLKNIAKSNVEFLGKKSDDEVTHYLQNCKALLFPGEEDFGITPVEAMACGKPVLGYGKGGLLETILPGKTGEFFDALTVEAFLLGLEKLERNYASYDSLVIREQAEKFSQEKFKREIGEIISKLM